MHDVAAPRQRHFDVNGMQLAAQEWGSVTGLPVLALHGWLDNSASFFHLARLLPDVHLVALDLAGHGQSSRRPGNTTYDFWDDIQDLFAVAEQLGWKRFALLGHSRGAIISALAAAALPESIIGIALVEGLVPEPTNAAQGPSQLADALKGLKALEAKQPTIYPDVETAIKARERGLFPLSQQAARLLTQRGLTQDERGYYWSTDPRLLAPSAVKLTQEHVDAFIHSINVPSYLVLADQGLPALHPSYLDRIKGYAHVRYDILQGGHHLHLEEQAPQVALLLQQFFARLGQGV